MISVIIMKRNGSYGVVEVPKTGIVYIEQPHLICGCTENGVKMVMYGLNSPLLPFETYIQNEALSLEIVGRELWHSGNRFLDFNVIELLQTQETINPVNSGSVYEYEKEEFLTDGGTPIYWNFKVKGLDLLNAEDYNTRFGSEFHQAYSIRNLAQGFQEIGFSTEPIDRISEKFNNTAITYFEDLLGSINTAVGSAFAGSDLEVLKMPGMLDVGTHHFMSFPNLKVFDLPNLRTFLAAENVDVLYKFNKWLIPFGLHFRVSRFMETSNNGALEADLAKAVAEHGAIIEFVD